MRFCYVLAVLLAGAPAGAQSPSQIGVLHDFAMVNAGEVRCPKLRINIPLLSKLFSENDIHGADIDRGGRFQKLSESENDDLAKRYGKTDRRRFCEIVEDGYGQNGVYVKDLIKRR